MVLFKDAMAGMKILEKYTEAAEGRMDIVDGEFLT